MGAPGIREGAKLLMWKGRGNGPGPSSLPLNMTNLYITYVVLIVNEVFAVLPSVTSNDP